MQPTRTYQLWRLSLLGFHTCRLFLLFRQERKQLCCRIFPLQQHHACRFFCTSKHHCQNLIFAIVQKTAFAIWTNRFCSVIADETKLFQNVLNVVSGSFNPSVRTPSTIPTTSLRLVLVHRTTLVLDIPFFLDRCYTARILLTNMTNQDSATHCSDSKHFNNFLARQRSFPSVSHGRH